MRLLVTIFSGYIIAGAVLAGIQVVVANDEGAG